MPALPLDEAGKYVAAVYVVFVLIVLIYLGIMAGRIGRLEREALEITKLLDERDAAPAQEEPTEKVAR